MSEAGGAAPASVQETWAPQSICFGCGPANPRGLHVRSHPDGDALVAEFRPEKQHEAFDGFVNGGILGTILDCHSNWTAAWTLMRAAGETTPPFTVTADYHVRFLRPTPSGGPLLLRASAVEVKADRAVVEATLEADGEVCATCRGTFVAVRPGHPAYQRW
jgi:acyl-coenzyme A thioesterase PaaI-like protein